MRKTQTSLLTPQVWPQGPLSLFYLEKAIKSIIERLVLDTFSVNKDKYKDLAFFRYREKHFKTGTFEEQYKLFTHWIMMAHHEIQKDLRAVYKKNQKPYNEWNDEDKHLAKKALYLIRICTYLKTEAHYPNHFVFQEAFSRALLKTANNPKKKRTLENIPSMSLVINHGENNDIDSYQISIKGHPYTYFNFYRMEK